MKELKVTINIKVLVNKVSDKFFRKHKDVYSRFIDNIKSCYLNKNSNVDIVALKGYKHIYRMRIGNFRVIYKLVNGEIIIIEVLLAGGRGQVYKDNKK